MSNYQSGLPGPLPWHMSWTTLVLALLALGTFIAIANPGPQYISPTPMMGGGGVIESRSGGAMPGADLGVPMMDSSASPEYYPYPYPYPQPDVPATDTREFLKVYYNASMQTRDVPGLTRRVTTTVRGYDGRVDQESSSQTYGSVSFAVPQVTYDAFRTELESLVGSRFLTVNISSQNLLPQKISIEEQQTQADTALANYKAMRQKIVTAHTGTVQFLQAKIDASPPQSDEWKSLTEQLANENASYITQLARADANISYARDWQKAVATQDQTFLENVATVTGTVSIAWISLWDSARLYLPGYSIPTIFGVLAILSYLRDRRRLSAQAGESVL